MQTLRNRLVGLAPDLAQWPVDRHTFAAPDNGDQLVMDLQRPADPAHGAQKPAAMVVHGLGGCSDSPSVRNTAGHLLAAGYPVARLNLRGSGPSRPLCRRSYNAGMTGDLAAALAALPDDLAAGGVVVIGYSLGGAMLANLIGEGQERHGPVLDRLACGLTVSAPMDLLAAARQFERARNRPYHSYVLNRLKQDMLATPGLSPALAEAVRAARSLPDFDDRVTAPLAGYRDFRDYYGRCSPRARIAAARHPLVCLHARDDPWIPVGSFRDLPWSQSGLLQPHLTARGGHCGFHARGNDVPWQDRMALALLRALGQGGSR